MSFLGVGVISVFALLSIWTLLQMVHSFWKKVSTTGKNAQSTQWYCGFSNSLNITTVKSYEAFTTFDSTGFFLNWNLFTIKKKTILFFQKWFILKTLSKNEECGKKVSKHFEKCEINVAQKYFDSQIKIKIAFQYMKELFMS